MWQISDGRRKLAQGLPLGMYPWRRRCAQVSYRTQKTGRITHIRRQVLPQAGKLVRYLGLLMDWRLGTYLRHQR